MSKCRVGEGLGHQGGAAPGTAAGGGGAGAPAYGERPAGEPAAQGRSGLDGAATAGERCSPPSGPASSSGGAGAGEWSAAGVAQESPLAVVEGAEERRQLKRAAGASAGPLRWQPRKHPDHARSHGQWGKGADHRQRRRALCRAAQGCGVAPALLRFRCATPKVGRSRVLAGVDDAAANLTRAREDIEQHVAIAPANGTLQCREIF